MASSLFAASHDLEESVRVDRGAADGSDEERLALIRSYYVTKSARSYLRELLARLLGKAEGERQGSNHWLYGYYGSGKSHLLAVTGLLLDSDWIESVSRDSVWSALVGNHDPMSDLRTLWEQCLDRYELRPLFANLLKEQGNRERGFGNAILRRLHEEQGLSPHLKTAFFEQWYLQNHTKEELESNAEEALREVGGDLPSNDLWSLVQKYRVLADGVLPALFEAETGTTDGLSDVIERSLNATTVAERIEEARRDMETQSDRPVRLLLLLDEITLFIGTQYGLLTELNALAEAIDEVGDGKILTIGTAQEDPSRVQTEYAAREVDFSILDDRFPHQYSLPSSHVGEIVRNRLLRKMARGNDVFEQAQSEAEVTPANSLVFYNVQKNTNPPLDEMQGEDVTAYLPLLPYHPPLFLDILSNLRTEEADRAKSIFSGTARAVLAIVNGLLERWRAPSDGPREGKDGDPTRIVSLVDFFEVIRPELKDIVPHKVDTIKEVEDRVDDGELEEIDAKVCKVVLLLQRVPDMIPLDDAKNIAVGLMDDLNGSTLHRTANAVDASLGRLSKYIRTDPNNTSQRHFTDREERAVLEAAEENHERFGPAEVVEEMATPTDVFRSDGTLSSLWDEVLRHLDLPRAVPYADDGDPYAVQYMFEIDGYPVESEFGEEAPLPVTVHVEGLVSDEGRPQTEHSNAFLWKLAADGRTALFNDLKRWAALSAACRDHHTPSSIQQQLVERSDGMPSRVASRIRNATLRVPEHDPRSIEDGVQQYIEKTSSSAFHPEMLLVDESRLQKLRGIRWTSDLPPWAKKIEVLCDNQTQLTGDIVTTVRATVGQKLRGGEKLSVDDALDRLEEKESAFDGVRPALVAHLWGLSKQGTFQPISEDDEPLSAAELLDPSRWHEVNLRIGQDNSLRSRLEEIPTVSSTDTLNEAIVKAREFIQAQRRQADTLQQQLDAARQDTASDPVQQLLKKLSDWLSQTRDQLDSWLETTRTHRPNWDAVIRGALRVQEQIDTAVTQWSNRESNLLQLDALLLLFNEYAKEIGEDAAEALDTLDGEAGAATNTYWWTDDGWTEYVDILSHRTVAVKALADWWEGIKQDEDRKTLLEKTDDNPWLASFPNAPVDDLGTTFQDEFLRPLRTFRSSMERVERILDPLTQDAHTVDAADVRRALGRLKRMDDLGIPSEETVTESLRRLSVLETLLQGSSPSDIEGIGLWPADQADLMRALTRLSQDGVEYEFDDTDHGLIIRPNA